MVLELYLDLLSQPCRAIYIFAKKNGIPFQLRTVELLKGQHLSDAFAQVNPLKKVPAMKDGDFTLTESVAILLYLTHKCKVPDFWYPQDLQARACVDEYLAWQHTTLRRSCLRALWHKVMFPVFLREQVSPKLLATTLAELDELLQLFEDKFLQNKAFLVGSHISLADLVAITELMHVSTVDKEDTLDRGCPSQVLKSCFCCPHQTAGLCLCMENPLDLWGSQTRQMRPVLVFTHLPLFCLLLATARGCWLPSFRRPSQAGCMAPESGGSSGGGPLLGGP
uniref:glutathione transferase n=1 Tax=Castor canadensis TaxID=51338 RepID=A0A8B7W776_CASCN|nr:glutathione S-transferase theta-1 isoform X1 [Castor canadensis]